VSHGWPYYAEELWLATSDRGLCASLYAASDVTAKVASGKNVTITETTDYPFGERVVFKISTAETLRFPLYLRVPGWCSAASIKINNEDMNVTGKPLSYLRLERSWKTGDTVTLNLPMKISVRKWEKNNNAISVARGPLEFSLKIGEKWIRYGGTDAWPENEVFATTPWNYGLVLDQGNPERSFEVIKKSGLVSDQPFVPEAAPIELRVKAKRITEWKLDTKGLVGKLQPSPVKTGEPEETVSLIPMGAARLRITSFPEVGNGSDAREWATPKSAAVSASHCFENDTVEAMVDGQIPKNSNDHSIPRFTWWDHRGTTEWVRYDFDKPRKISAVEVYWFDDTGEGNCRLPQSWKVLYRQGESWKEVEASSGYSTRADTFNRVDFKPVQADALKIEATLKPNFSGGILEWKIID
jgi:hypothetical protein